MAEPQGEQEVLKAVIDKALGQGRLRLVPGQGYDERMVNVERSLESLDRRVGAVEADVREIKTILSRLEPRIAELYGRVQAMPTTLHLLGFIIAIFVAAGLTRYFAP